MSDQPHVREVTIALPAPDVEVRGWVSPWRRLLGLWRHGVWIGACFTLLAVAVSVRVEVQSLRKDIERAEARQREAALLQERLMLEVSARTRAASMERLAVEMKLATPAVVERVTQ